MRRRRKIQRPAMQGLVDNLCGIYACMNALTICAGPGVLSYRELRRLFRRAVASLERQGVGLTATAINGMDTATLLRVLDDVTDGVLVFGLVVENKRPYLGKPPSKAAFIRDLSAHLRDGAAAAIIRFMRPDHWTVARGVSPRRDLLLFDSLGYERIAWRSFTLRRAKRDSYRYYIPTSAVIFLRLV